MMYVKRRNFCQFAHLPKPMHFGGIYFDGSKNYISLAGMYFGGYKLYIYLAGIYFGGCLDSSIFIKVVW